MLAPERILPEAIKPPRKPRTSASGAIDAISAIDQPFDSRHYASWKLCLAGSEEQRRNAAHPQTSLPTSPSAAQDSDKDCPSTKSKRGARRAFVPGPHTTTTSLGRCLSAWRFENGFLATVVVKRHILDSDPRTWTAASETDPPAVTLDLGRSAV